MVSLQTNYARQPHETAKILNWYDSHHRHLPWRISPFERNTKPDPYKVWLSEIMLQQTQVPTVRPYFDRFVKTWPEVAALGAASREEVMAAWAGLGYYSRARNLKKCAEIVAFERGGVFPSIMSELKKLPGIGEYTAAAIAAIAFNRVEPVVDGNVERVISRYRAIETPLPDAKPLMRQIILEMVPSDRPGDFAQAMMDLGAMICTPRKPACGVCPLNSGCAARATGSPEAFPVKPAPQQKPLRRGAAFVAVNSCGAILLRRRPERGLLGGMAEVPTSGWNARMDGETDISAAPFAANWREAGRARHVFTHFRLELDVFRADNAKRQAEHGEWWSEPGRLGSEALPSIFKKVIETAVPGATLSSTTNPPRSFR